MRLIEYRRKTGMNGGLKLKSIPQYLNRVRDHEKSIHAITPKITDTLDMAIFPGKLIYASSRRSTSERIPNRRALKRSWL